MCCDGVVPTTILDRRSSAALARSACRSSSRRRPSDVHRLDVTHRLAGRTGCEDEDVARRRWVAGTRSSSGVFARRATSSKRDQIFHRQSGVRTSRCSARGDRALGARWWQHACLAVQEGGRQQDTKVVTAAGRGCRSRRDARSPARRGRHRLREIERQLTKPGRAQAEPVVQPRRDGPKLGIRRPGRRQVSARAIVLQRQHPGLGPAIAHPGRVIVGQARTERDLRERKRCDDRRARFARRPGPRPCRPERCTAAVASRQDGSRERTGA